MMMDNNIRQIWNALVMDVLKWIFHLVQTFVCAAPVFFFWLALGVMYLAPQPLGSQTFACLREAVSTQLFWSFGFVISGVYALISTVFSVPFPQFFGKRINASQQMNY